MTRQPPSSPPVFDRAFLDKLDELYVWRRDVRHFRPEPLAEGLLDEILDRACLAPSVGNSQPWRFVSVESPDRRRRIIEDFSDSNQEALADYEGEKAKLYASLKLAGLREAPVHLAVFVDREVQEGAGLGRKTMPEMLDYSVAGAIFALWLQARARGVGMGWVSILHPGEVRRILDVPESWDLVGYMCVGYPAEENDTPELQRVGWQSRTAKSRKLHIR